MLASRGQERGQCRTLRARPPPGPASSRAAPPRLAHVRAKATAPASRSPSSTASIKPVSSASAALIGSARQQHLYRRLHAHQARQALRALGSWNDAQVDLRQPHLAHSGPPRGSGRHREFQAPAQRRAVERHDHGHPAVLDAREQVVHVGRAARSPPGHLLQPLDVRPCRKGPPRGQNHQGIRRRVGVGVGDGALDAAEDLRREGVDRRIVDADDGHRGVTREDVEVTGHLWGQRSWCGHSLQS